MTTIVAYTPSPITPFRFGLTLDGQAYVATVVWGLFGRRLYLNLNDTSGVLIFSRPVLGSPIGVAIQEISWYLGIATVVTAEPHGFAITDTVALTISGCLPDVLNGTRNMLITTPTEFTFPISPDPEPISQIGKVDRNIDIAAGYFTASSLVFRAATNAFEISP
jgi:hypothetical protein